MLRVNLTGTFLVTRAVLPYMIERGAGSLLAITSTGVPDLQMANAYVVSKAGIERLYLGLAHQYRQANIAVNCLAPTKAVLTEGFYATLAQHNTPLSEAEPPELIAEAAVYLCAQNGSGVTGTVKYSQGLLSEIGRL